jgi:kynurenine formamidase
LTSLLEWEDENGPLQVGSAIIFNFGWHRKWALGDAGSAFVERWPGLDRSLVQGLLDRKVRAVGTDCLGLDCSGSTEIPAHDLLLREDVLIIENLANLDDLPPRIFLLAAPLSIRNGSGSPIRALGLLPRN